MKFSYLMLFTAIVGVGFGVAAILAPALLLALYGMIVDATAMFLMRLYGTELIGFGMLAWLARNATETEARRAIVPALCVYHAVGFFVTLLAQLSGVMNALGWMIVTLYLLLALGFGYFGFRRG